MLAVSISARTELLRTNHIDREIIVVGCVKEGPITFREIPGLKV